MAGFQCRLPSYIAEERGGWTNAREGLGNPITSGPINGRLGVSNSATFDAHQYPHFYAPPPAIIPNSYPSTANDTSPTAPTVQSKAAVKYILVVHSLPEQASWQRGCQNVTNNWPLAAAACHHACATASPTVAETPLDHDERCTSCHRTRC
jgi:hypothetical protein